MAISKSDIKFYLTSIEPEIEQTIYSQSLGGYAAYVPSDETKSLVYPSTTLAANSDLYDTSLTLTSYSNLSGANRLFVNNELMSTENISSTAVTVKSRAINEKNNAHLSSDIVYGVSIKDIFNNQFNEDRKQYRCVAVRNNNNSDDADSVEFFIKQNSKNPYSKIRIALEVPLNDSASGTADSGTSTKMIDSSKIDIFDDNNFVDANLRFLTGNNANQSRIVSSFTSDTGTFVFNDALPYDIEAGDTYRIDSGPAQRTSSGIIKPSFSSDRVSSFLFADSDNPIPIDINDKRNHGSSLKPNDIVYIWIERSLSRNSPSFDDNSFVITMRYV